MKLENYFSGKKVGILFVPEAPPHLPEAALTHLFRSAYFGTRKANYSLSSEL